VVEIFLNEALGVLLSFEVVLYEGGLLIPGLLDDKLSFLFEIDWSFKGGGELFLEVKRFVLLRDGIVYPSEVFGRLVLTGGIVVFLRTVDFMTLCEY